MDYKCQIKDGTIITLTGVSRVEKDGSGRRFYGEDGEVIAAFDDGQSTSHWPSDTVVEDYVPDEGDYEDDDTDLPEDGE